MGYFFQTKLKLRKKAARSPGTAVALTESRRLAGPAAAAARPSAAATDWARYPNSATRAASAIADPASADRSVIDASPAIGGCRGSGLDILDAFVSLVWSVSNCRRGVGGQESDECKLVHCRLCGIGTGHIDYVFKSTLIYVSIV